MMKCFYCSNVSEIKMRGFCISCGKKLEKICDPCGTSYEKSANFCMSCGGKLSELQEKMEAVDIPTEDLPEIKTEEEEIFVLEEVSDDESVVIETNDFHEDKENIEIEINGSEPETRDDKIPEEEEVSEP
jgi:hypothetical protein